MLRSAIVVALLLAATQDLVAQRGAKAPAPVEMEVAQVNDRRGGEYFEKLQLLVDLPKYSLKEVVAARVLVASAVDETGRNLIAEDAGEPGMEVLSGYGDDDDPVRISFDLAPPSRDASRIREIRGEVELYMPSRDANSTATIPKFLASKGKALSHKALKANGVEISLVSDQQYEAEKKKAADAKRQEMVREEYPEDMIEDLVKSFVEYYPKPEENEVMVKLKDPKGLIQEITYVDGAGESKRVHVREDEGLSFLSTWEGKPENDWTLRVSMKTSKSLARLPFALANVELP